MPHIFLQERSGRPVTCRRLDAPSPALCEVSRYGEYDEHQRAQNDRRGDDDEVRLENKMCA